MEATVPKDVPAYLKHLSVLLKRFFKARLLERNPVYTYTIDDIILRSLGGAHDANITCIAGNVTPPPIPKKLKVTFLFDLK